MHSIDDLLHLVNSDGADRLKLYVGAPPVVVLGDEQCPLEGLPLTPEDTEQLLHSITTTRQRRELREHGEIQFIYRSRHCADFVVCAKMEGEHVGMEIH